MISEINSSLYNRSDKSKLNVILNVLIVIIIIALVFEVFFSINYAGIYVVGTSMNNTLKGAEEFEEDGLLVATTDGDYVYVNRKAKPTYGDIVVVAKNYETTIIKRVIALGGDYVMLSRGELRIKYAGSDKFVSVEESYVSPENNDPDLPKNNFHNDDGGYYVKEGYFFLLGDNRDASEDSRSSGSFELTSLFGVVTDWSLNGKSFFTAAHKCFSFDIPKFFGVDNRIKHKLK